MLRTVDTKYGLVCYPAVNARHAVRSTGTFSSVLLDDSRCSFAAMLFGWPSNLGYQGGAFCPAGANRDAVHIINSRKHAYFGTFLRLARVVHYPPST